MRKMYSKKQIEGMATKSIDKKISSASEGFWDNVEDLVSSIMPITSVVSDGDNSTYALFVSDGESGMEAIEPEKNLYHYLGSIDISDGTETSHTIYINNLLSGKIEPQTTGMSAIFRALLVAIGRSYHPFVILDDGSDNKILCQVEVNGQDISLFNGSHHFNSIEYNDSMTLEERQIPVLTFHLWEE